MIGDLKAALRQQVREGLKRLTAEQLAAGTLEISNRLQALPVWVSARTVLLFAPMPDEPDLWPALETALSAKKVGLPRFSSQAQMYVAAQVRDVQGDVCSGKYGIREPNAACPIIPWVDIDLVIVPGMAFDERGRRLGRGRGYYDRILAEVRGLKCGVAFDEQIVAEVPAESHDVRVNLVVTPTRVMMR
jgi:5-formyltetrahydrofolate cyclo-ligase